MKKVIMFGVIGVAAIAAAVFATISNSNNTSEMSDLMTKNIEAISQAEQPNLDDCVSDDSCVCVALHPTDANKDKFKSQYRW